MTPRRTLLILAILALAVPAARSARGDEGMWLTNALPEETLAERYGFTPSPAWVERVQRASVRIPSGGSASFVSPEGLVMTNHHVAYDQLVKLSTGGRDLLKDGFYAPTLADELRCPDVELQVLQSIEDVTARVESSVDEGMSDAEAGAARRGARAEIEQESQDETGLYSEVVELFGGARYHLYRYKRYDDVRLVYAPTEEVAAFGGDIDNFEFPRWCLDAAFYRAYEDGEPARTPHYFPFADEGAEEGDLVFVSGHPGRTQRGFTVAHLEFLRDVMYPRMLELLWRREVQLQTFAGYGEEEARMAAEDSGRIANGRKAYSGYLAGLHDPRIMETKRQRERDLRRAIQEMGPIGQRYLAAFGEVGRAQEAFEGIFDRWLILHRVPFHLSDLWDKSITLVQMADELEKPNSERLPAYRESQLDALRLGLFSEAPIHHRLEVDRIASTLSWMAETLGWDDPLVREALGGMSPRARAEQLVAGTSLFDVAERRRLAEGGREAIRTSDDPMIVFARALDPAVREVGRVYRDSVRSPQQSAYAEITEARFRVEGEDQYPDATFTLRLSFGTVEGYREGGERIDPFTTLGGMYERWRERGPNEPFSLPRRWLNRKAALDLDTPYNFVSTPDIIGGNSGSPVLNREGEVVGLIFDGNRHSLVWGTQFDERLGRSVAVDHRAILEALRTIERDERLIEELTGG